MVGSEHMVVGEVLPHGDDLVPVNTFKPPGAYAAVRSNGYYLVSCKDRLKII